MGAGAHLLSSQLAPADARPASAPRTTSAAAIQPARGATIVTRIAFPYRVSNLSQVIAVQTQMGLKSMRVHACEARAAFQYIRWRSRDGLSSSDAGGQWGSDLIGTGGYLVTGVFCWSTRVAKSEVAKQNGTG